MYATESIILPLSAVKPPKEDLLAPLRPLDYKFHLPADGSNLTQAFASQLAWAHPPIIHGKNNEVICGLRVYQLLLATHDDHQKKCPFRRIKTHLTRKELRGLACTDIFLTATALTMPDAAPFAYAFCRDIPEILAIKPFKNEQLRPMAKMFDLSPTTLRKLHVRIKKNAKTANQTYQ